MRYIESISTRLHLYAGNDGKGPVVGIAAGFEHGTLSPDPAKRASINRQQVRDLINALRRWEYRTGGGA